MHNVYKLLHPKQGMKTRHSHVEQSESWKKNELLIRILFKERSKLEKLSIAELKEKLKEKV